MSDKKTFTVGDIYGSIEQPINLPLYNPERDRKTIQDVMSQDISRIHASVREYINGASSRGFKSEFETL